jgi:hypothetical protein
MSLAPGSRLGVDEVRTQIGVVGMGLDRALANDLSSVQPDAGTEQERSPISPK